ncbi:MAG: thioredoxin domain-containing protein [Planctomycetota bacterium]|nr:thioredoxin domain-containing protein [Planctomycetota bacterium]
MLLTTLLVSCSPLAQEPAPAAATPPPAQLTVQLTPKAPAAGDALRWSPKGAKVDLRADGALLVGTFPLGPKGTPAVQVRLDRTAGATHFDVLSVDLDRDGSFGPTERLTTTPNEQRGKWWSSFTATVQVPFPAEGKLPAAVVPYPMSLWFVEDPQEPTAPPALRWSRRGWHEGNTEVSGKAVLVLVTEMLMDGVFTTADAWALAHDRKALLASSSTTLASHCWLDGRAFRAVSVSPSGREIVLASFDPGTTEAEEKARADIYKADREARRAEKPVAFGHDFTAALAAARQDGKRVFVDFETTWCGPCKQMDQWVYTAADVAAALQDAVCVKLDGDAERDLVKRFQVEGYPTMLLLDTDGKEVRRAVGYQGVAAIVKFLAR